MREKIPNPSRVQPVTMNHIFMARSLSRKQPVSVPKRTGRGLEAIEALCLSEGVGQLLAIGELVHAFLFERREEGHSVIHKFLLERVKRRARENTEDGSECVLGAELLEIL
jgi:hypothetical protein